MMYKMLFGNVPGYLHNLIPQERGRLVRAYGLRNEHEITMPRCHLTSYLNSFIPATINLWNETEALTKRSRTVQTFKIILKKKLFPRKVKLNSDFKGKNAINLARMRMGLSALNHQRRQYNFIDYDICPKCNVEKEDVSHFFLRFPHYAAQRITFIGELGQPLQPAGISPKNINFNVLSNIILHGCPILKYEENKNTFNAYNEIHRRF